MTRATVILRSKSDREKVSRWASGVPDGTTVEFKAPRRSVDQNALLWARLTTIAQSVDWYGTKMTAEDWKDVFSASMRKSRVVPGIDAGTFVVLGMRTSDMTKEEFGMLLDLIDAFAAERGVTFEEQVA